MTADSFFNAIDNHYKEQLPFVVYCKPGSLEIKAVLQKDEVLYKIDDFNESGFVFAPFDIRKDAVLLPNSKSTSLSVDEHIYLSEESNLENVLIDNDKDHFLKLVTKGLEAIKTNSFKKVVLSRKEHLELDEIDPIHSFKILLNTYNNAFVYCWYHPKVGLWLGATPEKLLEVDNNRISAMALAGTQLYQGTTEVAWGDKEIEEQQIVTDSIVDNLKPYVNEFEISDAETIRAGEVLHLKTDIIGEIMAETDSFRKVLLALHPTPAVCGMPKIEAMQFILDNEDYNREFYTGFIGELNKESKIASEVKSLEENSVQKENRTSHLFVNLRCMQIKESSAIIYMGCGITKNSDPESEWIETINKSKTIKRVIAY